MATNWYFQVMGQTIGPLSASEMRERARDGQLTVDTLVSRDGTDEWVTADRVKGLLNPPAEDEQKQTVPAEIVDFLAPVERKVATHGWDEATKVRVGLFAVLVLLLLLGYVIFDLGLSRPQEDITEPQNVASEPPTNPFSNPPDSTFSSPPSSTYSTPPKKWYSGGTLHKKSALEWQTASAQDKLATCGDFVTGMWQNGNLKPSIADGLTTVDDVRPYAQELVVFIDAALFEADPADENSGLILSHTVSELAAIGMVTMGWTK